MVDGLSYVRTRGGGTREDDATPGGTTPMIPELVVTVALAGADTPPEYLGYKDPTVLRSVVCDRTCRTRKRWRRVVRPFRGYLASIAQCESGGRWHINTGNGFYGGLQFTLTSWRAVGGTGYPHWATPLEQKYRAVLLSRIQGWGAWPVCAYA